MYLCACLWECVDRRTAHGGWFFPSVMWMCGLRQMLLSVEPSCQPYAVLWAFFFFNFIHFINIWGDFWEQICQDCILRKKTCLELYFNYSTSHSHWIVRIYIDIVYVSFFGCCSLCIKDMMLSCMNTLRGRTLFPRECFPAVVRWTWLIVCALMLLCLALRIF